MADKDVIVDFLKGKSAAKSKFYFKDFTELFPDKGPREVKKILTQLVNEEVLEFWSSGSTTMYGLKGAGKQAHTEGEDWTSGRGQGVLPRQKEFMRPQGFADHVSHMPYRCQGGGARHTGAVRWCADSTGMPRRVPRRAARMRSGEVVGREMTASPEGGSWMRRKVLLVLTDNRQG